MKDSTTKVLQALTLFSVAVVGLFLNIIVILVFYKRPALRSSSNRYVLSLVLANFLCVLGFVPVVLYIFSKSSVDCLSYFGFSFPILVVISSVFSILAIAVDRYNAVLSPLHYSMTITSQRNKETICGIWCISILLSAPPVLGLFTKKISNPDDDILLFTYVTVLTTVGFIVPTFVLVWVYARMYTAAHKNSERTRRQSLQANPSECSRGGSMDTQYPPVITTLDFIRTAKPPMLSQIHKRRCSNASFSAILFREEGRAVKTAVMVIASYFICWGPFFAVLLLSTFDVFETLTHTTIFLGILPMVTNSVLSPFIYVFRNDIARNEAVRLMFWWKKVGLYEGNVLQQANKGLKLKTSDAEIRVRHQSSSNYDSMSVQSFQLPINYSAECKQCAEPSSHTPVADFVATYEVVNSPKEESEKESENSTFKLTENRTRGESVTFRLAFLPQRKCQTCIRQNSDSSSGSAHPLLRESESPTPVHSAKRHEIASRVNSGEDGQAVRGRFCDSPKQAFLRHDKDHTIIEMEEHPGSVAVHKTQGIKNEIGRKGFWISNEELTEIKRKDPVRQDSDVTVDSGVDVGLDRSHSSNSSLSAVSPVVSLPKRNRHKLQRLSAVEDEDGSSKSKNPNKYPLCDFG